MDYTNACWCHKCGYLTNHIEVLKIHEYLREKYGTCSGKRTPKTCPECGLLMDGTCECLDYTIKGFCPDCKAELMIGDFDNGQCMTCGNTAIKEGLL